MALRLSFAKHLSLIVVNLGFLSCGYAEKAILFPTSPEALKKEDKFLRKLELRAFGEQQSNKDKRDETEGQGERASDTGRRAALSPPSEPPKHVLTAKKVIENRAVTVTVSHDDIEASNAPPLQAGVDYSVNVGRPPVISSPSSQPSPAKGVSTQKPKNISERAPTTEPKIKRVFVGFYCGTDGSITSVYPKAEMWSKRYAPVFPDFTDGLGEGPKFKEIASIFYGSYAYNNNSVLVKGKLFAGYDLSISNVLRLGIEIQGGLGWRECEVTSSGVYAQRSELAATDTIRFKSQDAKEIDFAYIRQTIGYPYVWSLLQKFGVTLSKGALLYTKLGFSYENLKITDHPEKIDVVTQNFPKKEADVIFKASKPTFVAGVGLEATLRNHSFFRMELSVSKGPTIDLQKDNLLDANNSKNADRTLERFKVSASSLSLGLGGGFRF
ncbi:MAG: hypothetical protein LBF66_00755 [Holosporales bacterium]|nr:hypothetical protein [Holosporales bacterium]